MTALSVTNDMYIGKDFEPVIKGLIESYENCNHWAMEKKYDAHLRQMFQWLYFKSLSVIGHLDDARQQDFILFKKDKEVF